MPDTTPISSVMSFLKATTDAAAAAELDAIGIATDAHLAAEAASRVAGDSVVQTSLNSEAATRAAADTSLSGLISAEAASRASADTALGVQITSEASTRASADTALAASIAAEEAARISAITAISATDNIVTDSTTSRTLALTDAGKYITFTNAGAITVTVPANASVAFPIGTEIYFRRDTAAGAITLSNAGVTVNGSSSAPAIPADGNFALKKKATNTWDLI